MHRGTQHPFSRTAPTVMSITSFVLIKHEPHLVMRQRGFSGTNMPLPLSVPPLFTITRTFIC
uniref:Uncharacterized protein n=1 Tax=Mesocestoides corti TaxID=53468 RepID=A0A5K3EQZ5_MESCO